MSNPSAASTDDPKSAKDNPDATDDISDTTPPTGFKPKVTEQEMTSRVFKFSFVYNGNTKNKIAPSVLHTHWMQAVQEAYGDEIIIINNKSKPVETVSTIKWTDPSIHAKQFKLHQKTQGSGDRRQSTFFIIHRVLTNYSLTKIRALHSVQNIMKDFKFYITDHQWSETEYDTTRIGWITNLNPTYYNREQAQIKFNTFLNTRLAGLTKKVKIPQYRMVFVSPTTKTETGKTVTTKAYAIEVLSEDAVQSLQAIKSLLGDNVNMFVTYSMKSKFPAGYIQAILYQTLTMNQTRVIVLQNISVDVMFYITNHFTTMTGVLDILPATNVEKTGRHTLLVDTKLFKAIRNAISQNLEQWIIAIVPSDAMPKEDQFYGSPRVKPIYDDGQSSGENSWMSASNASFLSMDLTVVLEHQYYDENVNIAEVFTYASIAISGHHTTATNKSDIPTETTTATTIDVSSDITEMENRQKQELEEMAANHRLEIAQLQALRIEDLRQAELKRETDLRQAEDKRIADLKAAEEKVNDATNVLRQDTDTKLTDMQTQLTAMMNTLQTALNTKPDNKRSADSDTIDDSQSEEKRKNVNSTPGKQLFPDTKDLNEDPALALQQKLYENAPPSPMKE